MQGLLHVWQAAAADPACRLPLKGMQQARLSGVQMLTESFTRWCMPCYLSVHVSSSPCHPTFSQMECRQLAAPAVPHHSGAPQVQLQAQVLLLLGPGHNLRQVGELQKRSTLDELIEAHKHGRPGMCKRFTPTAHTLPARTSAAVVRMGKMPVSYCTTA